MCVAAPGKVISYDPDEKTAEVDFQGAVRKVSAGLLSVKPGEHVMVHAGCIINVLSMTEDEEADELSKILQEVGAF